MFGFSRKKYIAVTLFEMLLVLFVSSMVAISTFKYQQQERISDIANPLSEKMYLYAQTVRQFVADNQEAIGAGTLNPFVPPPTLPAGSTFTATGTGATKTYKFTGITWLQTLKPPGSTVPYLSPSFSFSAFNPLELRRGNLKGDAAIEVSITSTKVTISYGALYEATGEQKLQGSVTAAAASKANKMYDPLLGISTFTYVGGIDKNGAVVPITATWDKAQSTETQINTDTNLNGDVDLNGDLSMHPVGTTSPDNSADITGVGTLEFDPTIGSGIRNLDKIGFSLNGHRKDSNGDPEEGGWIENLGDLDMVGDGEISGVGDILFDDNGGDGTGTGGDITGIEDITFGPGTDTTINFPPQGGVMNNVEAINFVAGGNINNIDTINFQTTGAGKLTGVQSVEFTSGKKFQGFGAPFVWSRCADTSNCNNSGSVIVSTGVYATKNICALSWVRQNDGNSNSNRACMLSTNPATKEYIMGYESALACGMICHPFSN